MTNHPPSDLLQSPPFLLRRAALAALEDDGFHVFDAIVRDRRFIAAFARWLRAQAQCATDAEHANCNPQSCPMCAAMETARILLDKQIR